MSTRILSLSPALYHALNRSGQAPALIDVRSPAEYRAGHAEGAVLLPLDEVDPATLEARTGVPGLGIDRTIYLTCASGTRARQAAERLAERGLPNVAVIEGGTEAWERAGLPMRRCGKRVALSLERQVQIAVGALLLLKLVFGFTVHELFFAAIGLIAAGLILAGATRWCGMATLLARMPWNRGGPCPGEVPA